MRKEKIVNGARAKMLRGIKMTPKEIRQYEEAIQQYVNDSRVEVMFLYFAEALHDIHVWGWRRIMKVICLVDQKMREWLNPDFKLDDLRERVYKKTGAIIAFSKEEEEAIVAMLRARGYKVKTEEDM